MRSSKVSMLAGAYFTSDTTINFQECRQSLHACYRSAGAMRYSSTRKKWPASVPPPPSSELDSTVQRGVVIVERTLY